MSRNYRGLSSFFATLLYDRASCPSQTVSRHLRFLSGGQTIGAGRVPLLFPLCNNSFIRSSVFASYTSSVCGKGELHDDVGCELERDPDDNGDNDDEEEEEEEDDKRSMVVAGSSDSRTIMDILLLPDAHERSKSLERCRVNVTPELVEDILSRTRNDWESAFTFFLWAGKQNGYKHLVRDYHSMIAILGKYRKFDTAWSLINDMRVHSRVTRNTIMIMIRKYAAVHDVARAINAFYALPRFKFEIGIAEFQDLLSALCRYKNVKDAEHLLFCNQSVFPLSTKSFNIILNGWCNIVGDMRTGRRIWKEMERRRIKHDVYSYSSIISCYSKVNNLKMVFRYYERMKALGIDPDKKVYNAVIHAMTKRKLVKEARELMKTMEEKGFVPDIVTYNALIMPLCKLGLYDEAKQTFHEMIERGLRPTVRTYHGFFRVLRNGEEVFELLRSMYERGCHPSHETYIMLIRKFCRWRHLDDVFKLWNEMSMNGLDPDRSSYTAMIHGLFLNGRLGEAHKYYLEMKKKDLLPEPTTDAMLQAWVAGKTDAGFPTNTLQESQSTSDSGESGEKSRVKSPKNQKGSRHHVRRQPEFRSVTRERGFSFWDQ